MSSEQAVAFFLFSVVAAVTPGPSNVLLAAAGANLGMRGGLACLLGASAGMGSMMLIMAGGIAGLAPREGPALSVVRFAGAAFLLFLAWRIATAPQNEPSAVPRGFGFREAAALQWVNPKAWVVSAGAAATFLEPAAGPGLLEAAVFASVFLAASLPCGFVWLAGGAFMRRLLRSERRRRGFNIAMGAALAASVATMVP